MSRTLVTTAQNTWCPGCGNFAIQHALKDVLLEMEQEGTAPENFVLATGIGCHGKIADYLAVNSFYTLHGRAIPVASGMALSKPGLKAVVCVGDGDAYAEGLAHLIFAAKRNIDITVIVHDNRVYGLTTGQYTPTSPLHFKGRSTPGGTLEPPLNPSALMLAAGAGFIARCYTRKLDQLREVIDAALRHKGFSYVEVLQICASFNDQTQFYDQWSYTPADHDPGDYEAARRLIGEWDYNGSSPIALGVLYRSTSPTFDESARLPRQPAAVREEALKTIVAERS